MMINKFYTWKSLFHALKFINCIHQIYFSRKIFGLTSSGAEHVSPSGIQTHGYIQHLHINTAGHIDQGSQRKIQHSLAGKKAL